MKKLFILATAAVAFASCSDSDLVGNIASSQSTEQPQAVEFGTYMGTSSTQTRSTGGTTGDITTKVLQESAKGFGVMAYVKGTNGSTSCYNGTTWNASAPNFMYNEKVTYVSTSPAHWTYDPVKFWPNDFATTAVDNKQGEDEAANAIGSAAAGKVSFFAYAPYVVPLSYTAAPTIKIKDADSEASAFPVSDEAGTPAAVDDGIVAMTSNLYTGEPQLKYVLSNASLSSAVDLLWGMRQPGSYNLATGASGNTLSGTEDGYNIDLTKQSVDETVDFYFKHALSKIGGAHYQETPAMTSCGLQVILDLDNGSTATGTTDASAITGGVKQDATLVTVEEIKIRDVATFYGENSNNAFGTTSDLVTSGWFNIAKGTWDEITGTGATYNSTLTSTDSQSGTGAKTYSMNPVIKEGTVTYDGGWKIDGTSRAGVTTTATDVYTNTSNAPALLLIPATNNDQTLVITVKYTVRTYDTKLGANAESGTWTKVTQTITNKVIIPKGSLLSNKYYKLLMHLGLTSIKFSATVSDWESTTSGGGGGNDNDDSANDKDIWLPSNTLTPTP